MSCEICELINSESIDLSILSSSVPKESEEQSSDCDSNLNTVDISGLILKLYKNNRLSVKEISEKIISIFKINHSLLLLPSLLTILTLSTNKQETRFSLKLIKKIIKTDYLEEISKISLKSIPKESSLEIGTDWEKCVSIFVSLPTRLSNLSLFIISSEKYANRLIKLFNNLLQYIFDKTIVFSNIPRLSYFLHRLIYSGYGFPLAKDSAINHRLKNKDWLQIYQHLFQNLPKYDLKIVISECISNLSSKTCAELFLSQSKIDNILKDSMIYDSFECVLFANKLSNILSQKSGKVEIIKRLIGCLSKDSAKLSFGKFKYLLFILLKLILTSNEHKDYETDYMNLISSSLDLSDANKLNLVKYFTVKTIPKIYPENKDLLKFNIDINGDIDQINKLLSSKDRPIEIESSSDSEVDSDDLAPFDDKNEYVGDVLIPKYLRDCLTGLNKKNEPRKIEACLRGCSRLISTRPSELCVVSEELTSFIVYELRDFELTHIQELKTNILVDLCVYDPIRTIPYLTNHITRDLSACEQVWVLKILVTSAEKLSRLTYETPIFSLPVSSTKQPNSSEISARSSNIFHKYSLLFILPLTNIAFSKSTELEITVFSQLIYTISFVLTHCRNNTNIVEILSRLIECINAILYHPDCLIIKSTLLLILNVIDTMSTLTESTFNELWKEFGDIYNWIKILYRTNENESIKTLSKQLFDVMNDKI